MHTPRVDIAKEIQHELDTDDVDDQREHGDQLKQKAHSGNKCHDVTGREIVQEDLGMIQYTQ